jgi:hypothetical protein
MIQAATTPSQVMLTLTIDDSRDPLCRHSSMVRAQQESPQKVNCNDELIEYALLLLGKC